MRLSVALLILSVILSMLGGFADLTGQRVFGLSRKHYWMDATYAATLAMGVHFILRK